MRSRDRESSCHDEVAAARVLSKPLEDHRITVVRQADLFVVSNVPQGAGEHSLGRRFRRLYNPDRAGGVVCQVSHLRLLLRCA